MLPAAASPYCTDPPTSGEPGKIGFTYCKLESIIPDQHAAHAIVGGGRTVGTIVLGHTTTLQAYVEQICNKNLFSSDYCEHHDMQLDFKFTSSGINLYST